MELCSATLEDLIVCKMSVYEASGIWTHCLLSSYHWIALKEKSALKISPDALKSTNCWDGAWGMIDADVL